MKGSAELLGIRGAISDFGVESIGVVYADSSAARAIANRKGAGKLRHINISTLWIQEKQDLHHLEMGKASGNQNPADLMTKYLTRTVIDTHFKFMRHQRAAGRARAGLQVQGTTANGAAGGVAGHNATMTIPKNACATPETISCFFQDEGP